MERRQYEASELRIEGEAQPVLTGHAAVFNKLSLPMFGFQERVEPGAFTESLKRDDVRALWNHDTSIILGRRSAKTLDVWEDRHGLAMRIFLPDTQGGKDAAISIGRGDVREMSYGFSVAEDGDEWAVDGDGALIRTLTEIGTTYEGSPVVFPAFPDTDVSIEGRSAVLVSAGQRFEVASLDLSETSRRKLHARIENVTNNGIATGQTVMGVRKLASVYDEFRRVLVKMEHRPRLMAAYRRIAESM